MALVPIDFPDRLASRGLHVNVFDDWTTCGGSADHRAGIFHHTASAAGSSGENNASYAHHGSDTSPHYNVLIARDAQVWLMAREKTNSSGNISSVALNEAHAGRAGSVSAIDRGLGDDTSSNSTLFAVTYDNNGVGEPWSQAMLEAGYITMAVAMECLGLTARHVSQHRVATARKIDCTGGNCPYDLQAGVAAVLGGSTTGGDDDVNEADYQRIASDVQRIVTDVLRKEGVSGAASKADKFSDAEKSDIQRIVTDVLRKENVSGAADD